MLINLNNNMKYLTKSKFKLALECPTKLYYADNKAYANQKNEDSFLKALAESGYQVEALARCYYPEGIYANNSDETTEKLLKNNNVIIFEATIKHQQYLVRTDILIKNNKSLKIIEVKAKSISKKDLTSIEKKDGNINSKWKPYIADIAFQKWVLKKAFPDLNITCDLLLVDKDSICPSDGLNNNFLLKKDDKSKLKVEILKQLTEEELSNKILKLVNVDNYINKIWAEKDENGKTFHEHFLEFSKLYFDNKKFPPKPKKECATCQFKTNKNDEDNGLLSGFKECWKEALYFNENDFKDPTVLDLWNYRPKDKCLQKGLIKLKDFHEEDINIKPDKDMGLSTTERQWLQIKKIKKNDNSLWIDKESLIDEIESWTYPLHFIDFETAMLPIPFKKGHHPYQGIAFQFSHHIIDKNGNVKHLGEYLNTQIGIDPSIDFIRALKSELEKDSGTIFRYSNHENTYLNFILNQLESTDDLEDKDELIDFIKLITKSTNDSVQKWHGERCMVDLLELVKKYYYDPETNGSNSIKKIFPSILRRSEFLQQKYSKPIYGSADGIPSKNFSDFQWIIVEDDQIKDPYLLLDPINKEASDQKIEFLFEDEYLKEGGAATIAYAKLQFTAMSDFERQELQKALLKYCELDTLAMVMIVEAWLDMIK